MTIRVCTELCEDHKLDEVEKQLSNTMYFVHSDGGKVYATVDLDPDFLVDADWYRAAAHNVELDLLNLGLLSETTIVQEIV